MAILSPGDKVRLQDNETIMIVNVPPFMLDGNEFVFCSWETEKGVIRSELFQTDQLIKLQPDET